MAGPRAPSRDTAINLRAQLEQRQLIDLAAQTVGRNRSEFMLEAACREAEAVLLDRRYFRLNDKEFRKFAAALDKPPATNVRLRKLMTTKAPWE